MRKIEQRIINALRAGRTVKLSKRDSVETYTDTRGNRVRAYALWGNCVFTMVDHPDPKRNPTRTYRDCGHQTATTKSRLNALLYAFEGPYASIVQRDFDWTLTRCQGVSEAWEGEARFTA